MGHLLATFLFLLTATFCVFADGGIETSPDGKTIEVQNEPEMQIVAVSKSVIVHGAAKDVLVVGGDVTIEGKVTKDVTVIGGSVIQKATGYIGGDVLILGGEYNAEGGDAKREDGRQTIVFGVLENELRDLGQNPAQILSPTFSAAFLAQRILSVLFWFIVSLLVTTLAPGAVSRAIARIRLSAAKIVGFGILGLIGSMLLTSAGIVFLPEFLSAMTAVMVLGLVLLAYLFGRVAIQLSIGKSILNYFRPSSTQSEAVANLLGATITTLLLSLPYIWPLVLVGLFSAGTGLVLMARTGSSWRTS